MSALELFKYAFMGTLGIVLGGLVAIVVFYVLLSLFGSSSLSKVEDQFIDKN